MKRFVEVEPICPFIGKACLADGWQWNSSTFHPCAFYDETVFCKDIYPQEPCRIKRAIARILADEEPDTDDRDVKVPWNTAERTDSNGKNSKA